MTPFCQRACTCHEANEIRRWRKSPWRHHWECLRGEESGKQFRLDDSDVTRKNRVKKIKKEQHPDSKIINFSALKRRNKNSALVWKPSGRHVSGWSSQWRLASLPPWNGHLVEWLEVPPDGDGLTSKNRCWDHLQLERCQKSPQHFLKWLSVRHTISTAWKTSPFAVSRCAFSRFCWLPVLIGRCGCQATPGKGDTYLSENISVTDSLMQTDLGRKLRRWDWNRSKTRAQQIGKMTPHPIS